MSENRSATLNASANPPTAPPGVPPVAPEPRRSPAGGVLLVVGIVLGGLLVAWGALHLVDWATSSTTTTHESYPADGPVELVADGEVTVRAADDVTGVEVDAVARGGLATPDYAARTDGDALVVDHRCPAWTWFSWTCAGELHAVLPAGTEVTVRSSNGDVRASGPVGDLDLRSSNGDVEAADLTGDLTATSSNGDVDVTRVAGDVDVESSNGRVDVVEVGGGAVAESSNGDVEVRDVGGDADARSSNGDVDVAGAGGDVFARTSNGDATVVGDGEAVALTIDTSNGEEIIEGPTDPEALRTVEIHSSNGDVAYLAP
ncbi:DUF4097 family beta strand repeat-containing protein [Isoptericola aurantiacus]|uniref:DUF4097 family beta strand repeat-containing protein n=1 Tax=Isoptericola aurantiacus TaxID=3377839 RepID=UPI00383B12FE